MMTIPVDDEVLMDSSEDVPGAVAFPDPVLEVSSLEGVATGGAIMTIPVDDEVLTTGPSTDVELGKKELDMTVVVAEGGATMTIPGDVVELETGAADSVDSVVFAKTGAEVSVVEAMGGSMTSVPLLDSVVSDTVGSGDVPVLVSSEVPVAKLVVADPSDRDKTTLVETVVESRADGGAEGVSGNVELEKTGAVGEVVSVDVSPGRPITVPVGVEDAGGVTDIVSFELTGVDGSVVASPGRPITVPVGLDETGGLVDVVSSEPTGVDGSVVVSPGRPITVPVGLDETGGLVDVVSPKTTEAEPSEVIASSIVDTVLVNVLASDVVVWSLLSVGILDMDLVSSVIGETVGSVVSPGGVCDMVESLAVASLETTSTGPVDVGSGGDTVKVSVVERLRDTSEPVELPAVSVESDKGSGSTIELDVESGSADSVLVPTSVFVEAMSLLVSVGAVVSENMSSEVTVGGDVSLAGTSVGLVLVVSRVSVRDLVP